MISPFAKFGARVAFGNQAEGRLERGECPRCGSNNKQFTDEKSRREHGITGLCQACQDIIFAEPDEGC